MDPADLNRGVTLAVASYVLWGLSPIFWRLGDGSADSILVVRILSTFVLLGVIQLVRDRAVGVRAIARDRRVLAVATISAALVATNWLLFIWSVNNERVLEASLGYFLNPLVSVVLGVTVLRESLRKGQWAAIAIAATGVLVLSLDVGRVPWIALSLALSFGLYGLIRKTAPFGSLDGLTIEVSLMFPIAFVALGLLTTVDGGTDVVSEPVELLFAAGAGLMTASPLLLFASAARRIELWMVGVLQYIAPTMNFLLGVFVYDETWSGGQVVGYVVIWSGLAVFAAEDIAASRRVRSGDGTDVLRLQR